MFTVDDEVAKWETALPSLRGLDRLAFLPPLAWHLRQRDTARAIALAAEALSLLPESEIDEPERAASEARMRLVHAEGRWLHGELETAQAQAGEVL
ncbi:MAG: hypothetical protein U1C86_02655, partial [Hydrogenophaga sp.]|nr:hypothetical protein [Hydrogenophaga sp.]